MHAFGLCVQTLIKRYKTTAIVQIIPLTYGQLIGKEAHSNEFLYLDFCLTPVVIWLLETKGIEIASQIPRKRLGQGISAFLIPSQ